MAEQSKIQWTDNTFNPWIGCTKVSQGCKHCYAEKNTFTRRERSRGRELWGPKADRHITSDANWAKPEAWNRAAEKAGQRARVFCASLADVFEDHPVLRAARGRLFALVEATPWLDWQLLTKRPEKVMAMVPASWRDAFPRNVWLGTSVEDQAAANERIPHLLRCPAAVRFLSCEPLLGPVRLAPEGGCRTLDWLCPSNPDPLPLDGNFRTQGIHWVIAGGESGPGARPCDVEWIRGLVRQCKAAGVPAFVKQFGAYPYEFAPSERGGVTDTNSEQELELLFGGEPEAWERDGARGLSRLREQQKLRPGPDWCFTVMPKGEDGTGWYRNFRLRDRKGGDPTEWPEDLRVREFPQFLEVSHG